MFELTASEIAGFAVGGLLLYATISAPKVDAFISASQRSTLGMCKRCGDLRMIACSNCKGTGSIPKGKILNLGVLDDVIEFFDDGSIPKEKEPCLKCCTKGRMACLQCSKLQ